MIYFRSFWLLGLTVGVLTLSAIGLASDQPEKDFPEHLRKKLGELKERIETYYHDCRYLTMRVSPSSLDAGEKPGWVLVLFDISPVGRVMDAEIVDSDLEEKYQQQALELVRTFRFRPKAVGNLGQEFENWVERVDFLPDGAVPDPAWPNPKDYFSVECAS
jgi:TonB family protein